jgi:hypothetical protein
MIPKETLKTPPIEDLRYTDAKYVQEACGTAYLSEALQNTRINSKPFDLVDNPGGCGFINGFDVPVKVRGSIYSIHRALLRSMRGFVSPARWDFLALRIFSRNSGSFDRRKSSNSSSSSSNAWAALDIFPIRDTGTSIVFCIYSLLQGFKKRLPEIR